MRLLFFFFFFFSFPPLFSFLVLLGGRGDFVAFIPCGAKKRRNGFGLCAWFVSCEIARGGPVFVVCYGFWVGVFNYLGGGARFDLIGAGKVPRMYVECMYCTYLGSLLLNFSPNLLPSSTTSILPYPTLSNGLSI